MEKKNPICLIASFFSSPTNNVYMYAYATDWFRSSFFGMGKGTSKIATLLWLHNLIYIGHPLNFIMTSFSKAASKNIFYENVIHITSPIFLLTVAHCEKNSLNLNRLNKKHSLQINDYVKVLISVSFTTSFLATSHVIVKYIFILQNLKLLMMKKGDCYIVFFANRM